MTIASQEHDIDARTRESNRGHWLCVVARRWKHVLLREYLQGADSITCHTRLPREERHYRQADYLLVWGRQTRIPAPLLERHPHLQVVTAEDGFISTRGLGLTGSFYYSLLFDRLGIHYDASTPSELNLLLNTHPFSSADMDLGERLVSKIRHGGLSKCNLPESGIAATKAPPGSKSVILAVGQLEQDQAIRCSLSPIRTNLDLLEIIRRDNPDAWVVFKPHPNQLELGSFSKRQARRCMQHCDHLALEGSITGWIDAVDAVHLISSTAGLEALIRGKPVHTYGTPAYAGWGLTHDWAAQPNRQRQLSLEQLVAITHGLYPRYFNWTTGRFETALETLRCLQRLESGEQPEQFFDADLQRSQQRTQRWRRGRVALLKPLQHWRRRRVQRMLGHVN